MWSSLKSHFGVSYKEITEDKFTEALSLTARVPLEGEYLPKQHDAIPFPSLPIRGIIALHLDGSEVVRSEFLPEGTTVATLDQFEGLVRHRGGVVLWDEIQQREFVRQRAIMRL